MFLKSTSSYIIVTKNCFGFFYSLPVKGIHNINDGMGFSIVLKNSIFQDNDEVELLF